MARTIGPDARAYEIAAAIAVGGVSALELVQGALARIDAIDPRLNCFTAILRERALEDAAAVDRLRARGTGLPPLAGVPFAVKNLFDVEGLPTLAGSRINAALPPAPRDATIVARLRLAGAILVGALNMDEYAFGFTTENTHYGPTRNPRDPTRMAGGSSGGSAAAVAAALVPLALGTDTNGSIRVPASLCGVFGLKPTYGRLSRSGALLFAASFDHVGPFARSVRDLATAYDAMQGPDPGDPAQAPRRAEPVTALLDLGLRDLRIARLGGWFERYAADETARAVEAVARALGARRTVELPEVARARAAAVVITSAEGANLHLENLRRRAGDFDPRTRDRFLAGALVPATWVAQAQRFRAWFRARVAEAFRDTDLLVAGATPVSAPPIGQEMLSLNGETLPLGPSLGLLTQPLSFIGLPVVTVPVARPGAMPVGVQLVAAPWREDLAFRAAAILEHAGVVASPVAAIEGARGE
jgi:AtzE family amidohydrolase